MRPRLILLATLLISSVSLTGCIGTESTESTTAETTEIQTTTVDATTATATSKTTTISYQDCPYHLAVEPASENDISRVNETLTYQELSPGRQWEFEKALRDGSTKLGTNLPSTWEGPRIIYYQGDPYYTVANVC